MPILHVKRGVSGKPRHSKPVSKADAGPEMVRTISSGGVYLGRVTMIQAHHFIREKVAEGIGGRGKQTFTALRMLHAQVDTQVPSGTGFTYMEDLGGHKLPMLKRPGPGSAYEKWHPELTFKDLRLGRMRPEKKRAERVLRRIGLSPVASSRVVR